VPLSASRLARAAGALLALAALAPAPDARAADGAIEIDATRAAAGGVTPGDAPGFPVTLSQPGSYVLTSNLVQSNVATALLQVTADDVTIDLGGFVLSGPVVCTGRPVTSCLPPGAGAAIAATTASRVHVHDGAVRGTARGIELGPGCTVERVRARSVGATGISCSGSGGQVRDSVATGNGAVGFSLGSGSLENAVADGNASHGVQSDDATLLNVSATSNGGRGVFSAAGVLLTAAQLSSNVASGADVGPSSVVTNVVASSNGANGILAGAGSLVAESVARGNAAGGVAAPGAGASIVASAASANVTGLAIGAGGNVSGSASTANTGVGISGGASCRMHGNTAVSNTGFAASLGHLCGYGANVLAGNAGGVQEPQIAPPGAGVTNLVLDANVCGTDLACP
jgi:hypothetical protein